MADSTAEKTNQKLVRHKLHCIREKYMVIEVQAINIDVLFLMLAYVALEMESTNNAFIVFFKWLHQVQNRMILFMSSIE